MGAVIERLLGEPALIVGLVRAVIILLVTFGVPFTDPQTEAIVETVGLFLTVVSLALTGVTRQLVVPAREVEGNG